MIKFAVQEEPHARYPGQFIPEWVYLYNYNVNNRYFSRENHMIILKKLTTSFDVIFFTAWNYANAQAKKNKIQLNFRQREAGSIKCWEIILLDRNDDFIINMLDDVLKYTEKTVHEKIIYWKLQNANFT